MLRRILFGLCLIPALAYAETACLEGPSGGRCHVVNTNGEVFKPAAADTVARASSPTASTKQPVATTNNRIATNNQKPKQRINHTLRTRPQRTNTARTVARNQQRPIIRGEQEILRRAQEMEAGFLKKQGVNNISEMGTTRNRSIANSL